MRLLAVLLAGCSMPSTVTEVPVAVLGVPVAEVVTPDGRWATAFCVGGDEWATCRHVVAGLSRATVSGVDVAVEVLAAGEGDGPHGDWAVFRTIPPLRHASSCVVDFERAPATDAWVVGYGWSGGRRPATRMAHVVPARVVESREDLLRLDLPSADGYHGMSGAPIVTMDGGRAVVVGVFAGRCAPRYVAARPTR